MKIIKVFGLLILMLLVGVAGYIFYIKITLSPSYSGDISIGGIQNEVEVYFTAYGVPHIYAQSDEDAYRSLGYVHAKERLWQMDLLRHVGSGRLSELFGPDMIKNDKFLRTMGLNSYAAESAKDYISRNHSTLPLVRAYIDGINSYILNNPKPLEHRILGIDVEPFEIQNVFETLTYMSFSFSNAHITDPVLTELSQKLDSTYLQDLNIYHYKGESTLQSFDDRYRLQAKNTISVLESIGVPEFIGSNSWVISPGKSATGKVILSNDPHIAFGQPSVWYESHLNTPTSEYYGYHIPGAPFPLLMHSTRHATGITMFENDDMDFYVEEIHPEDSSKYMHKGEWKEILSVKEVIKVKGEGPVSFTIRKTTHGPIVSDILRDDPMNDIVSMFWATTNFPNHMIEAVHGLTHGRDLAEIEKAASIIHGPGLNIMYGDSSGNVAWWAVGKLIKRRDERTSKTFYDGASGLDDADSVYSFSDNPHAINPPWNYVHSANNQPDTVKGVLYSGYYLPDDRGERIKQLLDPDSSVSIDDVKSMLLDNRSMMMVEVKGILLQAIKDTDRGDLLRELLKWNGNFNQDDFRPLIFQKWVNEVLKAAQYDEIGEELWPIYKRTHTYKVAAEHLIKNEKSKWWDNDTTDVIESRSDIIRNAFEVTVADLTNQWGQDYTKWQWGNAHSLRHNHAMGEVLGFLNIGDFPVSGGNEVLNNMGYTYDEGKYQTILFGPSTRRIVDFSDVRNNSYSILPTGQSGNYFSPHYSDQAEMFANGEFRKMIMNHSIIKQSENKMVMIPAN
ncbi:penicillin acylase family protein [Ekhidna sp.]|uniref:penicillin acylase family protein n=1 Tax=Ekhidna sp. TaxID=2608089 RepID=UPI003B514F56